jgi:hypothetical protein
MPTGQRYEGEDLLPPFENRHFRLIIYTMKCIGVFGCCYKDEGGERDVNEDVWF